MGITLAAATRFRICFSIWGSKSNVSACSYLGLVLAEVLAWSMGSRPDAALGC